MANVKDYIDSVEVSTSCDDDDKENLLDGDPNTYWESDGNQGTHWIRLQMKAGKGHIVRVGIVVVLMNLMVFSMCLFASLCLGRDKLSTWVSSDENLTLYLCRRGDSQTVGVRGRE